MTQLIIKKVTALPTIITPSTLYCINNDANGTLSFYLTNKDATGSYVNESGEDIGPVVLAIINAMRGQPNGLAELDANGNLAQTAVLVDGQSVDLSHNGLPVWGSMIYSGDILRNHNLSRYTGLDNHRYYCFRDGSTKTVYLTFTLPLDYEPGGDLVLQMSVMPIYTSTSSVPAGDVRLRMDHGTALGHGDSVVTFHPDIYQIETIPYVANAASLKPQTITFPNLVSTGLRPGSMVTVRILRYGSNALDTYNKHLGVMSIQLNYVKANLGTVALVPPFTS